MTFYDKFSKLCFDNGISPSKAAEQIAISKSTVSSWKSGRTEPTNATILKICKYFDVSTSYFSENGQKNNPPVKVTSGLDATSVTLAQAVEALNKFNSAYFKLNDKNRAIADNLIEALLKIQDNE